MENRHPLMLKYFQAFLGKYTAHPILAFVFLLGVGFAVAGFAVDVTNSSGIVAGHLVVYGIIATTLSATGYALFLTARIAKRLRRRVGPA